MTAPYNKNVLDKWLLMRELMGDPNLSRAALKLAFWLLDHLNGRTGQCNPGRRTLIRETSMDRSSIKRAQRELVGHGVFTITVGGGIHGKTNRYMPNWAWRRSEASSTPTARGTADPCTGGADGPTPGSSRTPKTVKKTVNIEPAKSTEPKSQADWHSAACTPSNQKNVDWSGWGRWLSEFHGIDLNDSLAFIMEVLDRLTEAGFSTAAADIKLDILFKVARKHGKPQPLGFIWREIGRFLIKQDSVP